MVRQMDERDVNRLLNKLVVTRRFKDKVKDVYQLLLEAKGDGLESRSYEENGVYSNNKNSLHSKNTIHGS
jgi:hypothetical protein